MPAVNPARLNFQIADLLSSFDAPSEFHRKIKDLFSLYANRTLRPGETTQRMPLTPAYHLPDPVMRQLRMELTPFASTRPDAALALADTLWLDNTFEVRQVAALLLGHAGIDGPEPVLSRLDRWLSPALDPALREILLDSATHRLQSRFPKPWEAWIESLLSRREPSWIALGLAGLRASLGPSAPHNLPAVYRIISPFVRDPHPEAINELRRLVTVLAAQSPTETAFFLKQALSVSSSPGTIRLVRQSLPAFPSRIQEDLKAVLRPH